MKKVMTIATMVVLFWFCGTNTFAAEKVDGDENRECIELNFQEYSESDSLSAADVVNEIKNANVEACGSNHWNEMQLQGLDLSKYDEIVSEIAKYGQSVYRITDIKFDDESFSVKLETMIYAILEGDTLSEIAAKKGTTVEKIMELNPEITNPDLIYPYRVLKIR